ncbi:MAG TPA: LysR family transcriptional regulator [Kofleriaceae bacterium]|nr:LysR family transcriptional regulator [Kofleriaceae bacterium]
MTALDLNLLRIFDALAAERNATRAARRLGMSQPAFSHALARLRRMLGDPLFVRVPRGMAPTRRALELEPMVRDLLAGAERLTRSEAFEPAACRRSFRIATTDYFEHIAFPRLVAEVAGGAPHAQLVSRPTGRLPVRELQEGEIDLAVAGFFGSPPDGFYQQKLFDETFVCVVRRSHPVVRRRLTLAQYTRLPHVLISPAGDLHGVVDRALAAAGRERRVAVGVGSFLSAGWIVATSDLVLTAPRRLAQVFARTLPVRLLAPPLRVPGFTVVQVWHERHHGDPAHAWLRRQLALACKPVRGQGGAKG